MHPKDAAEEIANTADPDQIVPFAQICLSENLGTLRYEAFMSHTMGDR